MKNILHVKADHEKEEWKVWQYLKTILTSTTTWVMLWSSVWPIGLTSENSASLPECQKKYINVMLKIWQKTCSRNAERMFTICHIFITFITMNPAILFVTRWQLKKKHEKTTFSNRGKARWKYMVAHIFITLRLLAV